MKEVVHTSISLFFSSPEILLSMRFTPEMQAVRKETPSLREVVKRGVLFLSFLKFDLLVYLSSFLKFDSLEYKSKARKLQRRAASQ